MVRSYPICAGAAATRDRLIMEVMRFFKSLDEAAVLGACHGGKLKFSIKIIYIQVMFSSAFYEYWNAV